MSFISNDKFFKTQWKESIKINSIFLIGENQTFEFENLKNLFENCETIKKNNKIKLIGTIHLILINEKVLYKIKFYVKFKKINLSFGFKNNKNNIIINHEIEDLINTIKNQFIK